MDLLTWCLAALFSLIYAFLVFLLIRYDNKKRQRLIDRLRPGHRHLNVFGERGAVMFFENISEEDYRIIRPIFEKHGYYMD